MTTLVDRPGTGRPGAGSAAPRLTAEQAGHLRHIDNLSRLPRGDWRHMAGPLPMQEDFNAYRYQLGYMSLALALAHYHRLPAAPVVFHDTLDRLIQRMLEPDVWTYWRDTSTQGGFGPIDLPQLPSRTDPVAVDNIMYSAYLQMMTLLFTMLFDDRRYEQPDSLTFAFRPILFGRDRRDSFAYDQRTLNERIYWNMVRNGYLGVACEPFCVFQICNQIPILGFRLHDHLYGGQTAEEVMEGYRRAWSQFGDGVGPDGHFAKFVVQRNDLLPTDLLIDQGSAWTDAWLGMLLNMWRPELVRDTYRDKLENWIDPTPEGTIAVRNLALPPGAEGLAEPGLHSEFGWVAGWASEMGDRATLEGLFRHADTVMNPQWDKGGLYYPRHDATYDTAGRFASMTPTVSNAMLPYARLNVEDGLRTLFQRPWTDRDRQRPALTGRDDDVDVLRAVYDDEKDHLALSVAPRHGLTTVAATLTISRVAPRPWTLLVDGEPVARSEDAATDAGRGIGVRRTPDTLTVSLPLEGVRDVDVQWRR
ncbi:hypothetical protein [Actinomycetospora sp. NBRC 106378]|uniref:linalool dehydratase/isomerase domain-containing protein n=1 Tax=Actinomycetospora sp. NBRC 106378 TaxID=3032208 RepID=UPI0024A508D3|nr:hypothetical protein [Actinomycetospora sp. NBRC 106378]GLZ53501.1 hypothetical protein Acsp07_31180 [Actinomycetospora sp. NBRC 106378]